VLPNPVGNENLVENKTEWIELVNRSDHWLALEGLTLSNEGVVKITFRELCLAPKAALVIYNQRDASAWVASTALRGSLAASEVLSFGITNSRDLNLVLSDLAGTLSALSAPSSMFAEGVSLNRSPDASPTGTLVLHDSLDAAVGSLSSEGLCANGARFEDDCLTP